MRLLVKFPSRARPQKLYDTLSKYVEYAATKQETYFMISLDTDDETATPSLVEKLKALHPHVDVHLGLSENKVAAINRDMDKAPPFDILLLASDDMIPVKRGYDEIIRSKMMRHYPDTDGVLWFNDGYVGNTLNTLVICGKKYYERFGFIYNPIYKSFHCDNEFTDLASDLGKQTYFPEVIIRHEHPANNTAVVCDSLYQRNSGVWKDDLLLYESRRVYTVDISILICTMPSRKDMLQQLLRHLYSQIQRSKLKIEILTDDTMGISVGMKRNFLLRKAKGKYCCFIDDDDKVSDNYIAIYETALTSGDYDTVALVGMHYIDGKQDGPFYHSIQYNGWYQEKKVYYRYTNHLNLIRTYIAKTVGFLDKSMYEDRDFSFRLKASGLIKTEYNAHKEIQYHYFYRSVKTPTVKNVSILPKVPLRIPR